MFTVFFNTVKVIIPEKQNVLKIFIMAIDPLISNIPFSNSPFQISTFLTITLNSKIYADIGLGID